MPMNNSTLHFVCVLLILCISLSQAAPPEVGFYSYTCPNAESIVESVVREATLTSPRTPALLLRLHFHDCFVEGCDGSILIDNGASDLERFAAGHLGLGGFGAIEKAKLEIESQCPGVVSCADIVAMAARDAIALTGGPVYEVETGRRDGRVSNRNLASDMPDVDDSIDTLISKFVAKGLSPQDLVLLSGAHTIGTTACFFMPRRLYNFNSTNKSDPRISPQFLPELRRMCPKDGGSGARISLDPVTPGSFDSQVMDNIKTGFAVLASDAQLYDGGLTREVVDSYAGGSQFGEDFAKAMVRMGRIGVKSGENGEIRVKCGSFN
ncbi:hypothetical protein SASPL_100769 [Salvia splendens]|uniref:Peroxidase n=1 Tax=Salvia splendens TaxID=180675 RepID=A0A8X8YUK0_SALSN|nr:peroxidase 43-like [Salvia splendens]KAG6435888.1 hypothetical protein SASPL_100769 [Salvia splendens]